MAYENVNISSPNMTGDRDNGYFYSFHTDAGIMSMYQHHKAAPGDPINSTYPLDEDIVNDVVCTQFDGYYYWTMERQTNGIIIKRWELISNILYKRDTFSYSDSFAVSYDAYSFTVDSYNDQLNGQALSGTATITVADGDVFNIGDTIVLGPSTNESFTGEHESADITNKSGNVLTLSVPLVKSFGASDKIYTIRYFYVFNKYSPYDDSKGSLLKYVWDSGVLESYSSSHMYGDVTASCFYDGRVLFVKGNEVIFITPDTLAIFKYMSIENLDLNRADNIATEAMWVYSDVLYLLQSKYVYFDAGEDEWAEEVWSDKYNYVTSSLLPVTYFIEVRAEPPIIHAVAAPSVPTTTSNITVTVLDQYRTPIVGGVTVNFTTTHGTLVPNTGTTDGSTGELTVVYNGTSAAADVEIKATVV